MRFFLLCKAVELDYKKAIIRSYQADCSVSATPSSWTEPSSCFTPSCLIKEALLCLAGDVGEKGHRKNILSMEVFAGEGETLECSRLDQPYLNCLPVRTHLWVALFPSLKDLSVHGCQETPHVPELDLTHTRKLSNWVWSQFN